MRVMVIVKGNQDTEAGVMPSHEELAEMGAFNEKLIQAGVMLAGDGLKPTSQAKRVRFGGAKPAVIDGPFAETKELIAGFWIWKVKDMDEALEWIKQAPFREGDIDLRPFFEAEDFGDAFTPELQAMEARQREQAEANARR